jgi:DnaK suppressor protein
MTASLWPARPDVSHLSADSLAHLHGLLVSELRTQGAQAAAHDATVNQLTGQTDLDSTIERELAMACAARAREAIEDIQHALARIRTDTYGACELCGAPIPFERLEAIPQARLCVGCPDRRTGMSR